jgi:hypothetical protein
MPKDERTYNYLHSRSRITVECALGLLKGRFRRLKTALAQKGNRNNGFRPNRNIVHPAERAARIIRSSMILHNILIDINDEVPVSEDLEVESASDDKLTSTDDAVIDAISGEAAKLTRDAVKEYLVEIERNKRMKE